MYYGGMCLCYSDTFGRVATGAHPFSVRRYSGLGISKVVDDKVLSVFGGAWVLRGFVPIGIDSAGFF